MKTSKTCDRNGGGVCVACGKTLNAKEAMSHKCPDRDYPEHTHYPEHMSVGYRLLAARGMTPHDDHDEY